MKSLFSLLILTIFSVVMVFHYRLFNSDFFTNFATFMFFLGIFIGILAFLIANTLFKLFVIVVAIIGIFTYLENTDFGQYINKLYNIGVTTVHNLAIDVADKTAVHTTGNCEVCITRSQFDNSCILCEDEQ